MIEPCGSEECSSLPLCLKLEDGTTCDENVKKWPGLSMNYGAITVTDSRETTIIMFIDFWVIGLAKAKPGEAPEPADPYYSDIFMYA